MAQAGGAATNAAGAARQVRLVPCDDGLMGLSLGVDDLIRYCVRMVELVWFACANSEQKARDFIQANAQGLLDVAGQDEQRTGKWDGAKAICTCDTTDNASVAA